jgi:GntR family transcriptional regulator
MYQQSAGPKGQHLTRLSKCISVSIHMDKDLLAILPGSSEPIYRQISAQLRRLITSGQLPAGEELPSVRDVAAYHAINPMTVSRAYSQLEGDGLLERRRGKGMVVAGLPRRPLSDQERLGQLETALRELARQTRELNLPATLLIARLREVLEDER